MLPSTKIAIGFIALAAGGYFGLRYWSSQMIDQYKPAPIKPGRLNVVGLNVGSGYRIVVQNRVAVLEIGEATDFKRPDMDEKGEDAAEISGKRRVPIKELLGSLQGDTEALGKFVMIMNELKESEFPPVRVNWKAEDIQKALNGDSELLDKLQNDLGVDMEGRPLPKLRVNSLLNGIIIHSPVRVKVSIEGKEETLTATILQHYQSRLGGAVESELQTKKLRGNDRAALQAIVVQQAEATMSDPKLREDVKKNLSLVIAQDRLQSYAGPAQRILASANIVVNDEQIEEASYSSYEGTDGEKFFTLNFSLTDEGRKRLWKYSRGRIGNQLLVVKDGIAIAAPKIRHELSDSNVDVTQLQEETLVKETVDLVRQLREGSKN
jgi:hypothetical protein